jgi:hypothetical protein
VKDSPVNYLVDAGPIIAAFDKSDQWHGWSAAVLLALDEPLHTTERACKKQRPRLDGPHVF